jgi:glycosyltransferase involved in cell wall biosynthesis
VGIKITIVTPSFNQGRFIRDTIESVLSQNYDNLEYIVIDGGSTDETIEILEEYKDRLYYISEPDGGQSDAINKGFKIATGDVVAWLNSDDTYEPGAVAAAATYFAENPNTALLYGEGYIIDESAQKLKRFENTIDFNLWMLIYVWDYIMQPTAFFRKSALEEVGYLDPRLHWTMDWDLWLKLSLQYDVAFLPIFLANSREYNQTKTSTGGFRRILEIRRLTARYSNSPCTRGFWLFFSDWLSRRLPISFLRKRALQCAVDILVNLPIPDSENRCKKNTRFSIRGNRSSGTFYLSNDAEEAISLTLYENRRKIGRYMFNAKENREITVYPSRSMLSNYTFKLTSGSGGINSYRIRLE